MLCMKLTFGEHIGKVADMAAIVAAYLCRVIINVGGPCLCIKRLTLRAIKTIMLYGIEVWTEALQNEMYRKRMVVT